MNRRLRIELLAFDLEPGQGFARVPLTQQRAAVAAACPLDQHVDVRIDPHRDRPFKDQRAGAGIAKRAAAGGDNPALAALLADQPGDHPPLAIAEIRLAMALEYFGD